MDANIGSGRGSHRTPLLGALADDRLESADTRLYFDQDDIATMIEPDIARPAAWPGHGRLDGGPPLGVTELEDVSTILACAASWISGEASG